MSEDKLNILKFVLSQYNDIISDITLNEVLAKQYDEQFSDADSIFKVWELLEKSDKVKRDFQKRINYLQGKADAYDSILKELNIDINDTKM
jgi:hypothetical protein